MCEWLGIPALPPDTDQSPVFISATTGAGLKARSVSALVGTACREAGVAWSGHRLRAKYLTQMVEQALIELRRHGGRDVSDQAVLIYAAQLAGHGHPGSLQPYLDLIRARLIGVVVNRAVQDRFEIEGLRRGLASLGLVSLLTELVGTNGDSAQIAVLLRTAAEQFEGTRVGLQKVNAL
jgi:hypothetical protein